jgi:hypothetical protein
MDWKQWNNHLSMDVSVFDYGMCLTEKGTLVIYGGLSEPSIPENVKQRSFISHNDLWISNVTEEIPQLRLISWEFRQGGFSRIVPLGGELLSVFGPKIGVKLLDTERMMSFEVYTINKPESIERTAFGLAPLSHNNFIIFGGYNQAGGEIRILSSIYILYEVKFYKDTLIANNQNSDLVYLSGIILPFGIIGFAWMNNFYHRKKVFLKKQEKLKILDKEMIEFNKGLKEAAQNRQTGETFENTMTLVLPNYYGLCIPIYKHASEGVDFKIKTILARGGFGTVFFGILLNTNLIKSYNNGVTTCVVKKSQKGVLDSFIQEIAIHEIFKDIKYFSKLICFSTKSSCCMVLRYYRLGTLLHFIRDGKLPEVQIEHDFEVSFSLARRLAWAINFMHSKGFVHNDIKPDNVLLESDEEESLYPVLTDFGITKLLEKAEVVPNMQVMNIKAGTRMYCAPEILKALSGELDYNPTVKSDVYSFSIVIYELFTRTRAWKNRFQDLMTLRGLRPELYDDMIVIKNIENVKNMSAEYVVMIIRKCWTHETDMRPTMEDVYNMFIKY